MTIKKDFKEDTTLSFRKQPRSRFGPERKKSTRVGSESLHSRGPFWARRRANNTDGGEKRRRMWDGTGGQRKRWPSTIRSSLARSFTYSLSSLVSILSPLCVLLIYRAAGKCLRHSPRSYNPSLSCSSPPSCL